MQVSKVMHQSRAGTLTPEEPDELIAHVRVCGGAGWVTTGSTRKRFSCSLKAARGEDLQVEHPVCGGYTSAFHLHPTLPSMLGAPLIRHQVVEMCQPSQKGLLVAFGMMKRFHHEQFPVNGVMGLIQE